ncbi:MAG TPA: chondroitinase-B domain-containing protein [Prolixibacteraceae bacterium]|nr:chondroitinase-B domain-containing protein [Prolixibacteraceae bacterium]
MNLYFIRIEQGWIKAFLKRLVTVTVGLSLAMTVLGKSYYVDSQSGLDTNPGMMSAAPWKTLDKAKTALLQPGDSLLFACGSSFTGGLEITASGTADQPIVLTSYGRGQAPKFSNSDRSVLNGNAIRLSGHYLTVDGLYFFDCAAAAGNDSTYTAIWEVGAVRIILGANHCTVKNCEFSNCPKGIQSSGEYALITKNYLHSANTRPLSSPGWGPIAIHMGNSHQEVSYNIIKDYYFVGGEFGADGGALELDDGRNPKKDIYIHHNYSSSNMGFLEVSWFADIAKTETHDLRIAYNVSDDYQDFVMLWAPTHQTYIENNTIFRRKQIKNAIVPAVFLCDYGGVTIRNNIIAVDSLTQVYTGKGEHFHTHNLYCSVDGSIPNIGTTLHRTEKFNTDPLFAKNRKMESDFSLSRKSPAINAGANLKGKYAVDFWGKPVPAGKATEMGAFEFQGRQKD